MRPRGRALRSELQAIVDDLLAASAASNEVALDAVGQAIGTRAITPVEIDAMLAALEAKGRTIAGPHGGAGEEHLKAVVAAARSLAAELGRPASVEQIAIRAGLSTDEVRHALALLKVMQR
jgi:2-hydroxychromene-2-carboxylate isomerase